MKTLKEYINESLLDDFDDIEKSQDNRQEVIQFLEDNYHAFKFIDLFDIFEISDKPNKKGFYEVKYLNKNLECAITNYDLEHLTNGLFIFTSGKFYIRNQHKLKDIMGFSEKFNGSIGLYGLSNLKTLKGLPKKITGGDLSIVSCNNLKTLEGCPTEVGGDFMLISNESLENLKGSPRIIKGICDICDNKLLNPLIGTPKEVKRFLIRGIRKKDLNITPQDIENVCKADVVIVRD